MDLNLLLSNVIRDAFGHYDYYTRGPLGMKGILKSSGDIFQKCVDKSLSDIGYNSVECGLGDHCISDLGLSIQLKTSVRPKKNDSIVFCRSSKKHPDPDIQLSHRITDVRQRVQSMFHKTNTNFYILIDVDLISKTFSIFQLYKDKKIIGGWLKKKNVCSSYKQTHFCVKSRYMVKL